MPSSRLLLLTTVLTLLRSARACQTDADCSFNGVCASSSCVCDSGWSPPACDTLNLIPVADDAGFYRPNTSSWCGAIASDPLDPSLFHLFSSEMSGGCGLGIWRSGSQVVHATSRVVTGPFERKETLIQPEAHNPQIVTAPDGTFLLYDSYGGPDSGCKAVTNYTTCKSVSYCACVAAGPGNFTFHSAPAPTGPWTPHTVAVNYPCHSCNLTPAPVVLRNGTILVALHCDAGGAFATCDMTMWRADDWRGPYTTVHTVGNGKSNGLVWNASQSPGHPEDPFLWEDARGRLHALLHNGKRAVHISSPADVVSFSTVNADQPPFAFTTNLSTVEGFVALSRLAFAARAL